MTDALREKLRAEIGVVPFSDLRAHAKRGGLFLVSGEATVLDVAVAVASDDKGAVEAYLADGQLGRPSLEQLAAWESAEGAVFEVAIVQPFVLARPAAL